LNNELQNLKKILSTYEDQNSNIIELEKKLKLQKIKYTKKIKEIEDNYNIEIKELNKKIYLLENSEYSSTLNNNNNNNSYKNNKNMQMKKYQNYKNSQTIINDFDKYENVRK